MGFMTLADVWSDWLCSVRIYSFSYQEATVSSIRQSWYLDRRWGVWESEAKFQQDQLDVVQVSKDPTMSGMQQF